jgi:hypothetical protein
MVNLGHYQPLSFTVTIIIHETNQPVMYPDQHGTRPTIPMSHGGSFARQRAATRLAMVSSDLKEPSLKK